MRRRNDPVTKTLRRLCESGLTLRAFALEAGYDPSLFHKIARGERRVTPETAEALVAELDRFTAECAEAKRAIRAAGREASRRRRLAAG